MAKAGSRLKRYMSKLGSLFGVRARLALLATILVVPLMLDRVAVLEDTRAHQISDITSEISELAHRGAAQQTAVISTVEVLLKALAQVYVASERQGQGGCAVTKDGVRIEHDVLNNISIVGKNGRVLCSTHPGLVGLDINDRPYFHHALQSRKFVLSDYLIPRLNSSAALMAAMPSSLVDDNIEVVIVTSVQLNWLSRLLVEFQARPGTNAFLLDSSGTVIGGTGATERFVGARPPAAFPLHKILHEDSGSVSASGLDGRTELMSFMRIPQTDARLVIAVDEQSALGKIDREISVAYVQFVILSLLVLIGAWFVAERLIVNPLRQMTNVATRFGRGDLSTRASHAGMPHEFAPLADAFNAMASQLADRERDLVAANKRLTVLASTDVVSGLANRRSFENRLELEWKNASEREHPLGVLMIDVDHFKLFNDRYGHPEGDACLRAIGDLLARAAAETGGFATRYGGEEFLMLLPETDADGAFAIAERVCGMVAELAIPHLGADAGVVTVSIGSAALTPRPGEAAARLIGAADAGLYAAKRRGRNQVVAHGPIDSEASSAEIVAIRA